MHLLTSKAITQPILHAVECAMQQCFVKNTFCKVWSYFEHTSYVVPTDLSHGGLFWMCLQSFWSCAFYFSEVYVVQFHLFCIPLPILNRKVIFIYLSNFKIYRIYTSMDLSIHSQMSNMSIFCSSWSPSPGSSMTAAVFLFSCSVHW